MCSHCWHAFEFCLIHHGTSGKAGLTDDLKAPAVGGDWLMLIIGAIIVVQMEGSDRRCDRRDEFQHVKAEGGGGDL